MDAAVPSCVSSIPARPRGELLGRHVIAPYPFARLTLSQSKARVVKIMARNQDISIADLQELSDDVTTVSDADVRKSEKNMLKLRKPGEVYEEEPMRIMQKKQSLRVFDKMRRKDLKNVVLLQKPEVGKIKPASRLHGQVSSDEKIMMVQRYKAQKSEYEMYLSRPVQVSLLNKPSVMEAKPQKEISLKAADALNEENNNEQATQFAINFQKKQKVKPVTTKLEEKVNIDLRKPSIRSSEPDPSIILDKETDVKLDSKLNSYEHETRQDIDAEQKLKEQLILKFMELAESDRLIENEKYQARDLNNIVEKDRKKMDIGLRKPNILSNADIKRDPKPKLESKSLVDPKPELQANIPYNADIKRDPKPDLESKPLVHPKAELETNLEMAMRRNNGEALQNVALHKKPEFDVGVRETGQGNAQDIPSKSKEQNSVSFNLSSAGTDGSSENEEWKIMEQLRDIGDALQVELTGYNRAGFNATYGSLVGFVPYRNVGIRHKFYAFESWLKLKGIDPAMYKKLDITGLTSVKNVKQDLGLGTENLNENQVAEEPLPSNSNLNFKDLLHEYEQEKEQFLTSFVGKMLRVRVVTVDQRSKKLIFTEKSIDNQEGLDTKRAVMAKLKVGDIVKCKIEKFAYFGIFVQVEGVTGLIPQGELLYDDTLDLLSSLNIGQVLDARVHELNFTRGHIILSMKRITTDSEGDIQSVVDISSFRGSLEATQPDEEWEDVELLINEVEKIEEVKSVCKGSFYLSSGLAPTFQVYMAPMVDDKYRLLARSGNKVQEVLVEASMGIEEMKGAILACTSRVA